MWIWYILSCSPKNCRPPLEGDEKDPEGAPLVEGGEAKLPPSAGQKVVIYAPDLL